MNKNIKDIQLEPIKYIQLESAAFLTDIDFQMMDAEQRGAFCSIIFYLYCNKGQIDLGDNKDITLLRGKYSKLATISGYHKTDNDWRTVWVKIAHKFQITGNILTHKRVQEELRRAENFRIAKSGAGKKGMRKRWGDNSDITKRSKVKGSEQEKEGNSLLSEEREFLSFSDDYINARNLNKDMSTEFFTWFETEILGRWKNYKPTVARLKDWHDHVWLPNPAKIINKIIYEHSTTTKGNQPKFNEIIAKIRESAGKAAHSALREEASQSARTALANAEDPEDRIKRYIHEAQSDPTRFMEQYEANSFSKARLDRMAAQNPDLEKAIKEAKEKRKGT